jgi:hypothetical protein
MFFALLLLAPQLTAARECQEPLATTFVVVDAATHEPVERFGVRISAAGACRASNEVDAIDEAIVSSAVTHPGGRYACETRPMEDRYRLIAPGYVPVDELVLFDDPSWPGRVTIELVRGSTLKGRVTLRDAAVSNAKLRLLQQSLVRQHEEDRPGVPFVEDEQFWSDDWGVTDPYWLTLPISNRSIDAHGFMIERLAADAYRLIIETDAGDRRVIDPLDVPSGGAVDLGEIALEPACRIAGHATLPESANATEWSVQDFHVDRYRSSKIDATGHFALERLSPGVHHVLFVSKSEDRPQQTLRSVRVAPGEAVTLDVDLTTPPRCHIALDVSIDGAVASHVGVALRGSGFESEPCELGVTDLRGHVESWSRALSRVRARFTSEFGLPLGTAELNQRLPDGAVFEQTIDLHARPLDVAWRADERFASVAQIWLLATERERRVPDFRVTVDVLRPSARSPRVTPGESRCRFGPIAPGSYDFTLKLFSPRGDLAAFRKHVEVPAVGDFTCAFGAADRVQ